MLLGESIGFFADAAGSIAETLDAGARAPVRTPGGTPDITGGGPADTTAPGPTNPDPGGGNAPTTTGGTADGGAAPSGTSNGADLGRSGSADAGGDSSAGGGCSFTADTQVAMADGTSQDIGDIKPGQTVVSTDPSTDITDDKKSTTGKTVVAHLVHEDTELTDVTVGDANGKQSVLHTTPNHPVWDGTDHAWTPASALHPGDSLESLTGTVTVTSVLSYAGARDMYNLTVADFHTYYVVVGSTPVLVHNKCISADPGRAPDGSTLEDYRVANTGTNAPRFVTEYTSPDRVRYYGRTTAGGVAVEPDSVLDDVLRGRHTGCAEVCAVNEAQKALDEIYGGTYRTLRTNSGEAVDPCEDYCQPFIRRTQGRWVR